ncbi:hypothetical protein CHARACLAT_000069 [Characodon lateralis]|uniref:Uncharacterized protein n=1 Tax=Characodon lateralis TaxID=208331 RepID=A0ABU7DP32_9TELE|nr:hypothetical protein [Characodon lateralis]
MKMIRLLEGQLLIRTVACDQNVGRLSERRKKTNSVCTQREKRTKKSICQQHSGFTARSGGPGPDNVLGLTVGSNPIQQKGNTILESFIISSFPLLNNTQRQMASKNFPNENSWFGIRS